MGNFKLIIEKGYQILQSPQGERINHIKETTIYQNADRTGKCFLTIYVNFESYTSLKSCIYDKTTQKLYTPDGEMLPFTILDIEISKISTTVKCFCLVDFDYETKHNA